MRKLCVLGVLFAVACGHKKASNAPPPPKPYTGAPVAFVAGAVKAGSNHDGSVDVKMYNFADKPVAQYVVLLRYHDASGAVLKVKPGTPFEKDFDFWSFSGMKYKCAPKSWCSFAIDNLDVPAKAIKAEVLASRVTALKDDIHFEEKPLFDISSMEWPAEGGAAPAEGSAAAGSAQP